MTEIKEKINEFTNALDSLKMEVKSQNAREKMEYKTKARAYKDKLKKCACLVLAKLPRKFYFF